MPNSVNIRGSVGMFDGFGFQISLFKDSCILRHFISSDTKTYKLKKTDSLSFGLLVPGTTSKLTLVKSPTYKKDDIVEGIIELTSEDYYETSNEKERKYKIQLTGYFKTEPLQSIDDKLQKFNTERLDVDYGFSPLDSLTALLRHDNYELKSDTSYGQTVFFLRTYDDTLKIKTKELITIYTKRKNKNDKQTLT